jgi:hypothetical protein
VYSSSRVEINRGKSGACANVILPVSDHAGASTIAVSATSCGAAGEKAEPFKQGVKVNVTSLARLSADGTPEWIHGATPIERETKDGSVNITGVGQRQLVAISARTESPYFTTSPIQYRYICCEEQVEVNFGFQKCAKGSGAAQIQLVDAHCLSTAWAGQTAYVNDCPHPVSQGVLKLDPAPTEPVRLSIPGMSLDPAQFDPSEGWPPQLVVKVSEQALPSPRPHRELRSGANDFELEVPRFSGGEHVAVHVLTIEGERIATLTPNESGKVVFPGEPGTTLVFALNVDHQERERIRLTA